MTHKYDKLDQVYAEHPEIKELVKGAADLLQTYYNAPVSVTSNKKLREKANELSQLGQAVDNRNWLK